MTLDAESTFKWKSNPALDALADPGGGIKRGGRESIWRASDDRRWHQEDGFAPITDSRKYEPRLGESREAATTVPAPGLLARQGGRDQAGKPAQCGRQTGRPTSTSNTTSSTRRSRARRERRRSRFGRGGMACTATTRRRPRLRIDRKLGRASAQPITTSSAICWMRASCSRVAIPVDIACSLEMRVASIQSEAGGQLGRCELHESRRRAPAFSAPILVRSVTILSPTR